MIEEVQVDEIVEIYENPEYKKGFRFGVVCRIYKSEGSDKAGLYGIKPLNRRGIKDLEHGFYREQFKQTFTLDENTGEYRKRFYPQDFTPEKRGGEPLKWL